MARARLGTVRPKAFECEADSDGRADPEIVEEGEGDVAVGLEDGGTVRVVILVGLGDERVLVVERVPIVMVETIPLVLGLAVEKREGGMGDVDVAAGSGDWKEPDIPSILKLIRISAIKHQPA